MGYSPPYVYVDHDRRHAAETIRKKRRKEIERESKGKKVHESAISENNTMAHRAPDTTKLRDLSETGTFYVST